MPLLKRVNLATDISQVVELLCGDERVAEGTIPRGALTCHVEGFER